jgi:hypothetical protein
VVQRADHLEACQHTGDAVEAAAGWNGIEMAAERDGRGGGIRSGAAEEHVADCILLMMEAERLAPAQEKGTGGGVFRGQCEPAASTFRRWGDFGDVHDGLPQAVGVDGGDHAAASFITVARMV